jgi:hypothetical protein
VVRALFSGWHAATVGTLQIPFTRFLTLLIYLLAPSFTAQLTDALAILRAVCREVALPTSITNTAPVITLL